MQYIFCSPIQYSFANRSLCCDCARNTVDVKTVRLDAVRINME